MGWQIGVEVRRELQCVCPTDTRMRGDQSFKTSLRTVNIEAPHRDDEVTTVVTQLVGADAAFCLRVCARRVVERLRSAAATYKWAVQSFSCPFPVYFISDYPYKTNRGT
jgi:hypothetical protein